LDRANLPLKDPLTRDADCMTTHPPQHDPEDDAIGESVRLGPGMLMPPGTLRYTFASSSGPGGQNVNKRATKASLRVALADLPLDPLALERLIALAGTLVTDAGELLITADEFRSQGRNKDACLDRLCELVARARVKPKVRRKTRPTAGSRARRLTEKKIQGERKKRRSSPGEGE
jgi:ribosome-associated protein